MDYEHLIERYARQPEKLNALERTKVEHLLKSDPAAAELFEFFQAFYEGFEAAEKDPSPEAESLAYRLDSSAQVITLHPLQPPGEASPDPRLLVLLASADHRVHGRILDDPYLHRLSLQVITDVPGERAHVVVSFPDLNLDLVMDRDGWADLPLPRAALKNPAHLRARLFLPLGRFPVSPARLAREGFAADLPNGASVYLSLSNDGTQLKLAVDAAHAPDLTYAVVRSGSHHQLVPWQGRELNVRLAHKPDSIVVFLY